MRFVWGIIWIFVGFLVIKFNYQFVNFFGHISWAEQHMGGGGTYTMYKIVGVIIIIMALMFMFNLLGAGPLGTLFPQQP